MGWQWENHYLNLVHHRMEYSVATKSDEHTECKNGYLSEPQFPPLQSGDNTFQKCFYDTVDEPARNEPARI